jgi:diadenosine tetraphosphate (Ap4A) HIT family hydrolase
MFDCVLCNLADPESERVDEHHEPLFAAGPFSVHVPSESWNDGHLVIATRHHAASRADLSEADDDLLDRICARVRNVIRRVYGSCVSVEVYRGGHPVRWPGFPDHFHVHLLPVGAEELTSAPFDNLSWTRIPGPSALSVLAGQPYVFLADDDEGHRVASLSSQKVDDVGTAFNRWLTSGGALIDQSETRRRTSSALRPALSQLREKDVQVADWRPVVFLARAMDTRKSREGDDTPAISAAVEAAGLVALNPLVDVLPTHSRAPEATWYSGGYALVDGNLQWLRRSDALLVDMRLADWTYIGCVCELVYAHQWRIPAVVMTDPKTAEREWLRYHATRRVQTLPEAVDALRELLAR